MYLYFLYKDAYGCHFISQIVCVCVSVWLFGLVFFFPASKIIPGLHDLINYIFSHSKISCIKSEYF